MRNTTLFMSTSNGTLWALIGSVVYASLQMIVTASLARLLQPEEFGLVAASLAVTGFAQVFSSLGIGLSIIQAKELLQDDINVGHTFSIGFGFAIGLLVYFLSSPIAKFFVMPELVQILKISALGFPLTGIGTIPEALLKRSLKFRRIALIDVLSFLLGYAVCSIPLAFYGFGFWALVYGLLAQQIFRVSALLLSLDNSLQYSIHGKAFKKIIFPGWGFTRAGVMNYLALQGDQMIVGRFLGADALGIYTRSYNLMARFATLIGQSISDVLFSSMSSIQDDKQRLRTVYLRGISLMSLIVIPMGVFFSLSANEVILIFLGNGWDDAILPFQILSVGTYFRIGYKINGVLAQSTGSIYAFANLQIVYALTVALGAIIGQYWGVSGVAWGIVASLALHFGLSARLAIGLLSIGWRVFLNAHIRGILLALLMVAIIPWPIFWGRSILLAPILLPLIALVAFFLVLLFLQLVFKINFIAPEDLFFLRKMYKSFANNGS